jgi:hypothetical protein
MRLAAVAAAALLASSCGHGKPARSAADVAPLETYALAGGQIDNVFDVLHLLPAGDRVAGLIERAKGFVGGGYVVLLDPSGRRAVFLSRGPGQKDGEKMLRREGVPYVRVRGWTVWSRQRSLVELVRHAKRHLSDAAWYHPASGDLWFVSRRLTLTARHDGDREIAEQTASGGRDTDHPLAKLVPDDAIAAAVFDAVPKLSFAKQIERGIGVRVADLEALFPHGGVAYMRAGQPVPSVTLLAPGGTVAAARRVVTELDPGAPAAAPATLDGVPLQLVHFGALDLYYGSFDGTLVLTDDPELRLHDVSPLSPAGLPEKTSEWLYLASEHGLPALRSLAALAGTHLSRRFEDHVFALEDILAYRAGGKLVVSGR